MTKIVPLGERVLVRREEAEEKTAGGIVLPDAAKEKPQQGTVLAVGEGRLSKDGSRVALQVKPEDKVLFTSWAGEEVEVQGEKVLLMREDDIMAIVG